MNPVAERVPYDGFAGGADNQLLLQAGSRVHHHTVVRVVGLETVMGNHGAFLGEALHMLGFLAQERLGYEQGKICVLHASLLEHVVQDALHLFPNGISIGFYDHAASHVGLLGEVGFHDQFVVPAGVILASFR